MRFWGRGGFSNVCEIPLYPGDKFDTKEVLGRSWGPTVGRMNLLATYGIDGMPSALTV